MGKSKRLVALSLGEDGEWEAEMGSSPLRPPVRLSRAEPGWGCKHQGRQWKDQLIECGSCPGPSFPEVLYGREEAGEAGEKTLE